MKPFNKMMAVLATGVVALAVAARSSGIRRRFHRFGAFRLVAGVFALVLGLVAGSAYAYFTSTGSGSGRVNTASFGLVVVQPATLTPSSDLLPGGTADLTLKLDNRNSFSVTITGIAQDGPVTVVGGTGCTSDIGTWPGITTGNSGVSMPTQSGLSIRLAPGTNDLHIPAGASMSSGSNTGCQSAAFEIPVTVAVQQ